LPGLRIGWTVSPPDLKQAFLERHDYTVIGPSPITDYLALLAVRSRERLFGRTRQILQRNYPILADWLRSFNGLFDWHPPECGAICFVRYRHELSAPELAERIRAETGVLLVPGDHFAMQGHLRFGYGNRPDDLAAALSELRPSFERLQRPPAPVAS
jgi:aspartate/methionine/tyrosine aminotransferase